MITYYDVAYHLMSTIRIQAPCGLSFLAVLLTSMTLALKTIPGIMLYKCQGQKILTPIHLLGLSWGQRACPIPRQRKITLQISCPWQELLPKPSPCLCAQCLSPEPPPPWLPSFSCYLPKVSWDIMSSGLARVWTVANNRFPNEMMV
jgi:hypothetical protein